ncbi:E3 ubiquitin-protein ligase HUWE1-like [Oopsacas minuta]|uniref:E3 ubiquitin-protein ligase HUWE1-like n=1 Tax=Oopsacas minuta TaxID=111878 RepID=A0AAV7JSB2_9METZ|nr:E3 ubiquitin-protein ligase HUWE1-like [Oopsacas minuta]
MKIDKIKLKRSVNDLPQSCRDVIQLFKSCPDQVLLAELKNTITWNFGKSELYHWIDVLNRFDQILSECTQLPPENPLYEPENIYLVPDIADPQKRELVLQILSFTALLIENANARHTYYSMEHLIALLTSNDLDVVLASLNVIFVFSKRCHYISRLPTSQRNALTNRLVHLAESMGGKESGFGLCKLSKIHDMQHFPASATSVHFEFALQGASEDEFVDNNQTIQLDNLYNFTENPQQILQHVLKTYTISRQKQFHLLYRIQRAMHFPNFNKRCQCIEAQLMAKSILIYSAFVPDFIQTSVEQGLIEELVEQLEVDSDDDVIMKLKAACFRNLTALLQQEREPRSCPIINKIISALDCQNYYGILASLVRKIIKTMTEMNVLLYSQAFITTLFSFLYHMAINETSATALIASGHIEFLIQVISWKTDNPLNVSLVTRAVRVIDLLSTLDIQPTQAKSICDMLFERLEMEMKICRRDAPYELPAVNPKDPEVKGDNSPDKDGDNKSTESKDIVKVEPMDLEEPQCTVTPEQLQQHLLEMRQSNLQCLPQRSALIKSLLNFFKKAASDLFFPETLRNLCESPLLPHLKHIISNVEYYGPTLYLPATEIVTNHILNEPSHLTPLQMTGLPGVVLNSLLFKPVCY